MCDTLFLNPTSNLKKGDPICVNNTMYKIDHIRVVIIGKNAKVELSLEGYDL